MIYISYVKEESIAWAVQMDNKSISSWIRQIRYRAKQQNIHSNVQIEMVLAIISDFNRQCAYCDSSPATSLDCPFPLKSGAPCVQANILPICKSCKDYKKNNDIFWMYRQKYLVQERYLNLIKTLLQYNGGDLIRTHIQQAIGIVE